MKTFAEYMLGQLGYLLPTGIYFCFLFFFLFVAIWIVTCLCVISMCVCSPVSASLSNLCHPQFHNSANSTGTCLLDISERSHRSLHILFHLFNNSIPKNFRCQPKQKSVHIWPREITSILRYVTGMQCTRLGRFSRYPTEWGSHPLASSSMRWSLVGISQGSNWDIIIWI